MHAAGTLSLIALAPLEPMENETPAIAATPAGPATLKHYEIRGKLGEGGFGQVFEAWDTKLCRVVAIKRLHLAGGSGASLVREARLAASLQHAAFVKIHAVEEDDDSQSIVMEYVPGQTLRQLLAARTPTRAETLDIVGQVARAMQEAHAGHLVHGDLKPSNLILEPTGAVRILDFGLASQNDPQATVTLSTVEPQGTIAYMAPERLLGAAPDAQGDIYALGVLLYELTTGQRPFAQLSGLALAAAQVQSTSAQWPLPDTADPAIVSLILAMTARAPAARLANMAQVGERLAAIAAGQPAPATPAHPAEPAHASAPPARIRAWRWSHWPRRARIAAGALAATAVLAGAAWQLAPWAGSLAPASLAPYSEAQQLRNGLAALRLFDRPGSLDAATAHFTTVLDRDPRHGAAAAGLSLTYSFRYASDGQDSAWLQRADAGAQQALALNEQIALSHVASAWVQLNQGRAEAALHAIERALKLDPRNFFALLGKTVVLNRLRRHDDAMAAARLGMEAYPDERAFHDEIAISHEQQSNVDAAERAYRRSIALQPDAVLAYANLSGVLLRQNRVPEALAILQEGLQVRPSAMLYDGLGNALFRTGDYVAAVRAFEQAVSPAAGNPAHYLYWANLGDALLWIPGRRHEARQAYVKARALLAPRMEREPANAKWASRMSLYSARIGDKDAALGQIGKALKLAPQDGAVHFRSGLAYELLGERDAALAALAHARELGYPAHLIETEPDLLALRRDRRYQAN